MSSHVTQARMTLNTNTEQDCSISKLCQRTPATMSKAMIEYDSEGLGIQIFPRAEFLLLMFGNVNVLYLIAQLEF